MIDTINYLVKNIVSHPEDVTIDASEGENNQHIYVVHVHKDDMGVVIGKQGRIIRAIRDLVKLVAAKHNMYVDLVLADESHA